MVAELTGCEAVNEALPRLAARARCAEHSQTLKRRLIAEMARITATLHARPRLPQRPLSLPLFPRPRAAGAGRPAASGSSLIDLHRLTRAHALARLVAMEGPGPVALFDRTASTASPTAIGSDSGGSIADSVGITLAALAGADGPAQGGALSGAQPQAALKADGAGRRNRCGSDIAASDNTKWR